MFGSKDCLRICSKILDLLIIMLWIGLKSISIDILKFLNSNSHFLERNLQITFVDSRFKLIFLILKFLSLKDIFKDAKSFINFKIKLKFFNINI